MEIKFNTVPGAESVPIAEHAPATSAPAETAIVKRSNNLGMVDHVPTINEIILPRINIVQGVGGLKDSFPVGSIVYNQSTVLYQPPFINAKTQTIERPGTPPLVITLLSFRPTQYVERVQGGARGLLVNSEAEVRAAGGSLDYREFKMKERDGMKRFEYLATALIAIERPEVAADDDTVFVYSVDDKKYALALWAMKGSSYTRAAKAVFFTARQMGCLRGGYPTHSFNLSTRLEPTPDKVSTYSVPVALPNKKSTPAFLEWTQSVLNAPTVEAPESEDVPF